MRLLCVIPARLGSTRLPHKPLRLLAGTPLIVRVVQRVRSLELGGRLVVATDDARVARAVGAIGARAVLTDPRHRSGTERVAEIVGRPEYADVDVVLNVQGDEPLIPAAAIHGALARLEGEVPVGTAAAPLASELALDPSRVKVSVDATGHATRFSRAPLPAGEGASSEYLQHIGVYAYTRPSLLQWVALEPTAEEQRERLEQLRALAHGIRIGVAVLGSQAPPSIDTERDLRDAEACLTGAAEPTSMGELA